MANEVDNVMAATTEKETMIVGAFPQIIVTGTEEKPFYQIMYLENEDGEIHLGFGSYDLAYVFQWLKEFFCVTHASAADPATLRPKGRWEPRKDVIGFVRCSVCHDCNIYDDWADGEKWRYCPNCGAKMEG